MIETSPLYVFMLKCVQKEPIQLFKIFQGAAHFPLPEKYLQDLPFVKDSVNKKSACLNF